MLDEIEAKAQPLRRLLADQEALEQRFAANLQQDLLPLVRYADRSEENLRTLIAPEDDDAETAPRPIAVDPLHEQHQIDGIRTEVERQEQQLRAQFDAERCAIDAALAIFDAQAEALDTHLSAAERAAERISDGVHSATFARVLDFLDERAERLSELAFDGALSTHELTEIAPPPAMLFEEQPDDSAGVAAYLRPVLDALSGTPAPAHTPPATPDAASAA